MPRTLNGEKPVVAVDMTTPCIPWDGRVDKGGYARDGRDPAYWKIYEEKYGPRTPGMEIDHVCGNGACRNVLHLEEVTPKENRERAMARRTHCHEGHEYTEENVYVQSWNGRRRCRKCMAARQARYRRNKARRRH